LFWTWKVRRGLLGRPAVTIDVRELTNRVAKIRCGEPLIKNAINEGASVIQYVVEDLRAEGPAGDMEYDSSIIGAGPAGFSAAVCASERGLRYVALDQKRVGSTVRDYPAAKYIFFKPETAGVKGLVRFPELEAGKKTFYRYGNSPRAFRSAKWSAALQLNRYPEDFRSRPKLKQDRPETSTRRGA
jgi:hypothetical protein